MTGMGTGSERARTEWVAAKAAELGFDLCGVAPPDRFPELEHMTGWLDRGHAGEMRYLHDPRRLSPERAMDGVRSIIVCVSSYRTAEPLSTEVLAQLDTARPRGWISRYGWGDDYHDVLLPRLRELIGAMREEFGEDFDARAYVDTGPVVERVAAKYAGMGWLAKNTCLINQKLGSFLFLGTIVTTLELEPTVAAGQAPPADLCGSCRRCIDACPTGAFVEPYVMDPRRCIAYFTIELRGAIPEEFRPAMGQMVFGCDICQDVCPWNQKAARGGAATLGRMGEFRPWVVKGSGGEGGEGKGAQARMPVPLGAETSLGDAGGDCDHVESSETGEGRTGPAGQDATGGQGEWLEQSNSAPRSLFAPELEWIASLGEDEYRRVFRRSPVKRAKYRGLVRNACVALGNSGEGLEPAARERILKLLERLAGSPDELIAEHARWAMGRLGDLARG
jgi:epoxyqueuosine reductase